MKSRTMFLVQASCIAALYVILSMLSNAFGLANGVIQVRVSEALCILPVFFPSAIPGLFVGCLISNLLSGAIILDVIFGSIATLLGALGTYYLRKNRFLSILPPIISNTIIVALLLKYAYGVQGGIEIFMLTVGIGELISAGILGEILYAPARNLGRFYGFIPETNEVKKASTSPSVKSAPEVKATAKSPEVATAKETKSEKEPPKDESTNKIVVAENKDKIEIKKTSTKQPSSSKKKSRKK